MTDPVVVVGVAKVLVARRKRIVPAELVVETRTEVGSRAWIGDCVRKRNRGAAITGIEGDGVDGGEIVDIPPLEVEEKRCFFAQRATKVPVKPCGMVTRLGTGKGIRGVESRVIPIDTELPVKLVGAGFGVDFKPSGTELVLF